MAPIIDSVEIARTPQEVFAYVDDLKRHGEWQEQIVEVLSVSDGPTRVGTRATEKRQVPGGAREFTYEIVEHDPPRKASFRVLNGPVRPYGTVTVEALDDRSRSRFTLELDFEGHGIGKLLAPLARRDARKQVPKDQVRLKERLEAGV
jgi:uncharacterized membrane protein